MAFWLKLFAHKPLDQKMFPLILLIGEQPDSDKFFTSTIFDALGSSVGLFRKDVLAPTWKSSVSFRAIKKHFDRWNNISADSSIIQETLLPLARRIWGKNCELDAEWSFCRIVPLRCYLLVLNREPRKKIGSAADAGYVPNIFPLWGKFYFEELDGDGRTFSGEGYDRFIKEKDALLNQYYSEGDLTRSGVFSVRIDSGAELQTFMSQLMALLRSCQFNKIKEGLTGWWMCPHGRYLYKWGGWPEKGVCAECVAKGVEPGLFWGRAKN